MDQCYDCEYYDECEDRDNICVGCKDYNGGLCPLTSIFAECKKGISLQCNNGYEEEDDYEYNI